MASIQIELNGQAGTIAIDGSEPQPFQSIEQVCQALMALGQAPNEEEAAAFAGAQPQMPEGRM